MMNILNGGTHANSNVNFKELNLMPVGMPTVGEGCIATDLPSIA